MILDSPETIRAYTAAGWWGTDTLDDLFRRNAAANPERLALVDPPNRPELTVGEPKRLTYAEVAAAADALAAELARRDIGPGDVVMVQLPNVVELPLVYLAAARIGAIVSPLPVQYRQHELRHTMGLTEPKVVITAANVTGFDHAAMVRDVAPDVPVITIGEELDAILAMPAGDLPDSGMTANDILTICWTSGTEAEPKGVPRSHNHWIAIGWGTTDGARLAEGDVLLNPFPMVNMSGIGGMFVPWLQVAGTLVMHHPMALPVFLGQIGRERANYTVAPPILLTMLLANEQLLAAADFSSMKVIGSGSAPLSAAMVVGWKERFGIDVTNFFGSNEGTGLVGDPATVPDPGGACPLLPALRRARDRWRGMGQPRGARHGDEAGGPADRRGGDGARRRRRARLPRPDPLPRLLAPPRDDGARDRCRRLLPHRRPVRDRRRARGSAAVHRSRP